MLVNAKFKFTSVLSTMSRNCALPSSVGLRCFIASLNGASVVISGCLLVDPTKDASPGPPLLEVTPVLVASRVALSILALPRRSVMFLPFADTIPSAVTVNPRFANFAPLGPALNAAANSAALLTGVVSSRVSVLTSTDTVSVVGLVAKSIGAAAGLKAKGRLAAVGGMGDPEICRLTPLTVISSPGE